MGEEEAESLRLPVSIGGQERWPGGGGQCSPNPYPNDPTTLVESHACVPAEEGTRSAFGCTKGTRDRGEEEKRGQRAKEEPN